jgi:hypothetical protein
MRAQACMSCIRVVLSMILCRAAKGGSITVVVTQQ